MASRGLGSLTLDLIAKIGGFTAPMSQAERDLDKKSRAMQRRAKEMSDGISLSFKTLGAGIAGFVTGFVASFVSIQSVITSFNSAVDKADKLDELSARLGISTERLSEWGYTAERSGTSLDSLSTAIPKLSKLIAAAGDESSKSAELFKSMGISVRDASGRLRDVEQVLPEIASKFKTLNNDTLEQALAMELFGKSGAELLEFLNRGATGLDDFAERAKELGIVISDDTATAAGEFRDRVDDLMVALQGLFLQALPALLPELTKLVERLVALTTDGERTEKMVDDLSTVIGGAASIFEFVAAQVSVLIGQLAALHTVAEGVISLDWSKIGQGVAQGVGETARSAQNVRNLFSGQSRSGPVTPGVFTVGTGDEGAPISQAERDALEGRITGVLGGGGGGSKKKTGKSDAEKEADRLKSALESLNKSLDQQIALFGKTTEAAKVYFEVTEGDLAKLAPAQKGALLDKATELDLMQQRQDLLEEEAKQQEAADEARAKGQERVKEMISDMEFELELLGMGNAERAREIALRYAGADATEEQRQRIAELTEQTEAASKTAAFWENTQRELSDAMFDLAKNAESAEDIVKNFFDAIADYITRMIADAWAQKITDLFKASTSTSTTTTGGGGGGGWGAFFGSLLSAFGGGRASGGSVLPGMFYRVNENGPEMLSVAGNDYLMMGDRMGRVTPNMGTGGGAGVGKQEFHYHVQGALDRSTREQLARKTGTAARRGMGRTGG